MSRTPTSTRSRGSWRTLVGGKRLPYGDSQVHLCLYGNLAQAELAVLRRLLLSTRRRLHDVLAVVGHVGSWAHAAVPEPAVVLPLRMVGDVLHIAQRGAGSGGHATRLLLRCLHRHCTRLVAQFAQARRAE